MTGSMLAQSLAGMHGNMDWLQLTIKRARRDEPL